MANDITLKSKSGVSKYPKTYSRNILDKETAPTLNSTNVITSGGVYSAISGKQDTLTSGTGITIVNNVIAGADLSWRELPEGHTVTFSTITVSGCEASTGGFYVTLDGRAPSGSDYDLELYAENYGDGVWRDSDGNALTVPFTKTAISTLRFIPKGNSFTIALDGETVLDAPYGEYQVYSVDVYNDCTLTGTAVRTD